MRRGSTLPTAVLIAGVATAACGQRAVAPPPARPQGREAATVLRPDRPQQREHAIVEGSPRAPRMVRFYIGPAQEGGREIVTVDVRTQVAQVVAVDGELLPRPARENDRIAVELFPGGHCFQVVSPPLWEAFRERREWPAQVTKVVWFQAKPGARYRIVDLIMYGQMRDQLRIIISELGQASPERAIFTDVRPPASQTCPQVEVPASAARWDQSVGPVLK